MTDDRNLPDPSDYSDNSEPLDEEAITRDWEDSVLPQDAIQALTEMKADADYEVTKNSDVTEDELVCVELRALMLEMVETLKWYVG